MAVVRFKRAARRRVSLRHYLWTNAGPFRLTSRLARELAHRQIAVPQFANSVQRMVEVFVETEDSRIKNIDFRATHARFDKQGKADLHHAAEVMAIILEGRAPKKFDEGVLDISSILRTRKRERETQWRIPQSLKRAIVGDIRGKARVPLLRVLV
jgi:hypothetical protein